MTFGFGRPGSGALHARLGLDWRGKGPSINVEHGWQFALDKPLEQAHPGWETKRGLGFRLAPA